jgi:Mg-chelatase subunit ChlD
MLITKLNRHLDTVQIKQAGGNWAAIDHSKTTSITMQRQRKAFLNMNNVRHRNLDDDPCVEEKGENGETIDTSTSEKQQDRIQCATNLREYLAKLKSDGKEVKGKKVGLDKFTQDAKLLIERTDEDDSEAQEERDILDSQWRDNSSMNGALGNFIAMCDTSGSMEGDPINAAVALACRVVEKSALGKRVMTFSATPEWIDLDHCSTFTEMVSAIFHSDCSVGTNTDFYKALDMILTVIEKNKIPQAECENMVLAIFSDMQIDANLAMMNGHQAIFGEYELEETDLFAARSNWSTMFETIKQKYRDVGMRLYGAPIGVPHILFWNLRKTSGFPTLSTEKNTSMMSGYDAGVLNLFCNQGMDALRKLTGSKILDQILATGRYDIMEDSMRTHLG